MDGANFAKRIMRLKDLNTYHAVCADGDTRDKSATVHALVAAAYPNNGHYRNDPRDPVINELSARDWRAAKDWARDEIRAGRYPMNPSAEEEVALEWAESGWYSFFADPVSGGDFDRQWEPQLHVNILVEGNEVVLSWWQNGWAETRKFKSARSAAKWYCTNFARARK